MWPFGQGQIQTSCQAGGMARDTALARVSGSADAILQSLNLVVDEKPDIIVVVGADHVYRMDFSEMVEQHIESGAACTVAAIRQPISLADLRSWSVDAQEAYASVDISVQRYLELKAQEEAES